MWYKNLIWIAGAIAGLGWASEFDWHQLADPTRPYAPTASGKPITAPGFIDTDQVLHLTYTYVSPRQRLAVINGKRYRIGDEIGGYKIATILPNRVNLTRGRDSRTLATTASAVQPLNAADREN